MKVELSMRRFGLLGILLLSIPLHSNAMNDDPKITLACEDGLAGILNFESLSLPSLKRMLIRYRQQRELAKDRVDMDLGIKDYSEVKAIDAAIQKTQHAIDNFKARGTFAPEKLGDYRIVNEDGVYKAEMLHIEREAESVHCNSRTSIACFVTRMIDVPVLKTLTLSQVKEFLQKNQEWLERLQTPPKGGAEYIQRAKDGIANAERAISELEAKNK
jgi:hypothetical protein